MKQIFFFLFIICLVPQLEGQIAQGNSLPLSLRIEESLLPRITVDVSQHHIPFLKKTSEKNEMHRIGYVIPFAIPLNADKSTATALEKGYLWRYEFKAKDALGLNLYFSKYHLPEGAQLYLSNADYSLTQGAFGAHNNTEEATFALAPMEGEKIYVEYFEPYEIDEAAILELEGIGYIFRDFGKGDMAVAKDFGDAGNCQVNVNCIEGSGKENQKRAVVRILVKIGNWLGWCTGTVMNNTANDCKPYILTADHCALLDRQYASSADRNMWIFYFNYQGIGCSSPSRETSISYSTMTGALTRAQSVDSGGIRGSDFLLLELNTPIPNSYNAYYAGWSTNITTYPYSIHHPAGDIKKISSGNGMPTYDTWGGRILNTHLSISWASTTNGHGTTEGGSSGGPLFNTGGLVIGTLTGGYSSCSSVNSFDYYGYMGYHLNPSGTQTNTNTLKPWLANGSNTVVWNGLASSACSTGISVEEVEKKLAINIYPNPSTGRVHIALENTADIKIEVVDILGRKIWEEYNAQVTGVIDLDLSQHSNGVYFIHLISKEGTAIKKIILQR